MPSNSFCSGEIRRPLVNTVTAKARRDSGFEAAPRDRDGARFRRRRLEDDFLARDGAAVMTRTFLHIPGIGRATERLLWKAGIDSWRGLLTSTTPIAAALRSRRHVVPLLKESCMALKGRDARFFSQYLPRSE